MGKMRLNLWKSQKTLEFCDAIGIIRSVIERFGELPEDVDQLKAPALDALVRVDLSETQARVNETDAESLRSQTLSLTAKVEDLTQTNAAAKAEIDRLTSIIKTLRRDRFGKRSEKLGADEAEQQGFVFEEIETGLAAIATRLAAKADPKPRKPPRHKPRFPSHLERVEEILEPEVPPECEGKERVKIGQEESVRLDVVRARFRLIVTIRPKYAYKEPAAILQAPAPEHIVEAGLPTEALLAQVAVSKYADGLPLYRQEAIYARDGVERGRSLMAQWMGAVGFIATMLQTCKISGLDLYAWAKQTLERIANRWPNKDIEALMPWNFKPAK
jgi:transposase